MNNESTFLYYKCTSFYGGMLIAPTMAQLNNYIMNGAKNPTAVYKCGTSTVDLPIVGQVSAKEIEQAILKKANEK